MSSAKLPIQVNDIVLPFRKDCPMVLYENRDASAQDCLIRAHPIQMPSGKILMWYAESNELTPNQDAVPKAYNVQSSGLIVFIAEQRIPCGYGVRITRLLRNGYAARGVVCKVDAIRYPSDVIQKHLNQPLDTGEQACQ